MGGTVVGDVVFYTRRVRVELERRQGGRRVKEVVVNHLFRG